MQVVTETNIKDYPLIARGKVRDIYGIDDDTLLLVATDRMSAFDVIMAEAIPYKGVVLNQISLFWLDMMKNLVPNHLKESTADKFPSGLAPYADMLEGRSMLVKKAKPLPIECIVRGHLAGSGWKDYKATGCLCGHALSANLLESSKLEMPIFTPSTKAELGSHDENITEEVAAKMVGPALYEKVRDVSLAIFTTARDYAEKRGIIIADTKFEFGMRDGELTLIDEVLTPDSSRFWPADEYQPGRAQKSFDKQFLRDWLQTQPWDMAPPPPALPEEIVQETSARYLQSYELLTGKKLVIR